MSEIAVDLALAQELANLAKKLPVELNYRQPLRVVRGGGMVSTVDADGVTVCSMHEKYWDELMAQGHF